MGLQALTATGTGRNYLKDQGFCTHLFLFLLSSPRKKTLAVLEGAASCTASSQPGQGELWQLPGQSQTCGEGRLGAFSGLAGSIHPSSLHGATQGSAGLSRHITCTFCLRSPSICAQHQMVILLSLSPRHLAADFPSGSGTSLIETLTLAHSPEHALPTLTRDVPRTVSRELVSPTWASFSVHSYSTCMPCHHFYLHSTHTYTFGQLPVATFPNLMP